MTGISNRPDIAASFTDHRTLVSPREHGIRWKQAGQPIFITKVRDEFHWYFKASVRDNHPERIVVRTGERHHSGAVNQQLDGGESQQFGRKFLMAIIDLFARTIELTVFTDRYARARNTAGVVVARKAGVAELFYTSRRR